MQWSLVSAVTGLALLAATSGHSMAQDADRCIDTRGYARGIRLVNQCSFDVNVRVCCSGEGALASCQGGSSERELIPAGASFSPGSCDGYVYWLPCADPKVPTEKIEWADGELWFFEPMCVTAQ